MTFLFRVLISCESYLLLYLLTCESDICIFIFAGLFGIRSFGDMSDQSFWDNFYASRQGNKGFDWFVCFEDIAGHLVPYLPTVTNDDFVRILDIGCGTSNFSLKLFEHLSKKCRIECVDFSPEAIKAMEKIIHEQGLNAKQTHMPGGSVPHPQDLMGLVCHQADAKNLPFKEGIFSLAFDKGTSDAVLKGPNGESAFVEVVKESLRVLKPDGKLIQFSDEPPEMRLHLLEKVKRELLQPNVMESCKLTLVWRELENQSGLQHFMYVIKRATQDEVH